MLVVNDSIKNAYSKYTTQRKSYIRVGNNSFFVQNLDVSADAYFEGNVIGNAIAKITKFDIETTNVSGIDEFELFDGIWTGNQYEYISLGTFKLFNEEGTDDFFSSVTAYDKLVLFNKEYDPTQTTYPTTLYGLLQNICSQAGVELENTSIPNGNQSIASNLFVENETLKIVLNAICQISGNYAIISKDKLKLLLKGTETIKLNKSQISYPEYKRTTWKINQVVLGMSDVEGEYVLRQDNADIEKNGVHKLVINDNPFVYTQALREAYIDNLFNQVKGFGYTAFDTQWEGLPYVELGDLLNIDGKESIVLRYNLKSPDGLKSTLSAPSIIDSVIEYVDNSNSIKNRQKRTEISVDKQNQRIEAVASDVNKNTEKVASLEITTGNISTKVSSVETDLNTTKTNLSNLSDKVNTLSDDIDGVSANFEDFKDNEYIQNIDNLQKQIDGAIQFWNGAEIPTINNYPANLWTTENDKINHQADIYTVVKDVEGEMKQGKSYRFDKVNGVWQWIELTDNELSAVQALAQEALNKANTNANEIGTVKTRVSLLEQSDEQIKASVESIDKQIVPTNTATGSSIYIEDASDSPLIELEIEGKSEQEIRNGKNKFRLKDISSVYGTYTYLTDNSFKLSSNNTNRSYIDVEIENLKPNTTYNLSFDVSNTNPNATTGIDAYYDNNGSWTYFTAASGYYTNKSFTIPNSNKIQLRIYGSYAIVENVSTIKDIQLEEGTTKTSFEPYGVSPSPDYPSEIKSVGYENLFNPTNVEQGTIGYSIGKNYGSLKQDSSIRIRTANLIKLDSNKTYTISCREGYDYVIQAFDDNGLLFNVSNFSNTWFSNSQTFSGIPNIAIAIRKSDNTSNIIPSEIENIELILVKGVNKRPYIPHNKYGIEVVLSNQNYYPNSGYYNEMGFGGTLDTETTLNGYSSVRTSNAWAGPYLNLKKLMETTNLKVGDTVTYSIYFKTNFEPTSHINFSMYRATVDGTDANFNVLKDDVIPGEWQRIKCTFTLTEHSLTSTNARLETNYYDKSDPYHFGNNRTNTIWFACPQLEKGTEMTDWVESTRDSTVLVLNEPPRSLPNGVKDIAYIKNNKLYVDRYVGSVVLDGKNNKVSNITLHSGYITVNYYNNNIKILDNQNIISTISNKLVGMPMKNTWNGKVLNSVSQASNGFYLQLCLSQIIGTTNEKINEWLSTHNTQVDYELAEPYTEEYGEIDMPSTVKGVNNIYVNDELEPNINIEYVRDTTLSNYVEGQINKVMTIEERHYSELVIEDNSIKASVTEINSNISDMTEDIHTVQETLTSTEKTIEIISTNIDKTTGEIREVTTINGYRFNKDGLNIYTNENSFNTLIDNEGTYYKDGDTIISETTKDGFMATNIKNKGGQEYCYDESNKVYEFVKERIEVDGEYGYATFYNGVN